MIKHGKKTLIIKKFDFSKIGMKKLRKNSNYKTPHKNAELYINWVLGELKQITPRLDNMNYNATSLYMNEKNIEKLHKFLDPMTWLNYAPTECNNLKDDEYGIDLSEVLEEKNPIY